MSRPLTILSLCACAAACATVTTADGRRLPVRSDAFRSYAETVFRQQNSTLDEVALRLDTGDDAPLESAELELLTQCEDLNELAQRRRDDLSVGLGLKLRAARTTPDCERALQAVQALLGARR